MFLPAVLFSGNCKKPVGGTALPMSAFSYDQKRQFSVGSAPEVGVTYHVVIIAVATATPIAPAAAWSILARLLLRMLSIG
jgi:hypothetical protein